MKEPESVLTSKKGIRIRIKTNVDLKNPSLK